MQTIPTVKELRQSGHKVRIERFRPYFIGGGLILLDDNNARMNGLTKEDDVYQCGGVTVASIRSPKGEEARGVSECALTDPFVKRAGVEIAIARALEMPIPEH